jgi:hypothetical protein
LNQPLSTNGRVTANLAPATSAKSFARLKLSFFPIPQLALFVLYLHPLLENYIKLFHPVHPTWDKKIIIKDELDSIIGIHPHSVTNVITIGLPK